MDQAHVELDLGFFPLMWILYLIRPWMAVDGQAEQRRWGKQQLTLPPGIHTFEAWYPYFFRKRTSLATMQLELRAGASYRLKYRPALLVFLAGSMKLVEGPALPPATARQLPPSS